MTVKAGKICFFACFFIFLFVTSICESIDVRSIEEVRNKDVLDNNDLQIIDKFVAEAVHDIVDARDFSEIASIRKTIVDLSSSNKSGPQAQYRRQFYQSAYNYISEALKSAEKITDERRAVMIVNLLILIDGLKDSQLSALAVERLNDENMAVRYWAVRCVTNHMPQNPQMTDTLISRLSSIADKSSPQILEMMASFAFRVKSQQGKNLMVKIADTRIKQYSDWTVKYELIDASILKTLAAKISGESTPDPILTQRFAQLFSCVIQRYVKGGNILNETQKQHLVSVIVETERECIIKRFGLKANIKEAIEAKNTGEILAEHNVLLGDASKAGQLATKFNFRYTDPDGKETTEPTVLPEFRQK